jgi:hypothetical protein
MSENPDGLDGAACCPTCGASLCSVCGAAASRAAWCISIGTQWFCSDHGLLDLARSESTAELK